MNDAMTIADFASRGRGTDSMMAHVTPGDFVIPRYIVEKEPAILAKIKKSFDEEGADYRDHIVGHEMNSYNPETGQPEFFFKKLFKRALPILGTIAGTAIGAPYLGTALAAGLGGTAGSLVAGNDLKTAALTGAASGLGASYLGSGAGDVAGNLTSNAITRPLGTALAGTTLGAISQNALTGALAGQSIAGMVNSAMTPPAQDQQQQAGSQLSVPEEKLDISRPDEMSLPGSLAKLQGLDQLQKTTNIATEGVEGGGVSDEGRDYFLNQVRRRLTDTSPGQINPIEQNYLSRIGVAYQPGNTKSILEGIARYQAA